MLPKIWTSDEFEWKGQHWTVPKRRVLPKPFQQPHTRMYLACTSPDSFRLAAQKGIGVLSSASYAVNVLADLVKVYREALTTAEPVGAFITNFWGNNVHAFCDDDDQYAKDLAAQSMKTFFGPDKPYIQGRINAYEELLEAWGGIPDHLQADFGRWLRQSDADKVRSVQQAIAAEPPPSRVPRERKPMVLADDGPLVLVETRKDLSQLGLPFERQATAPAQPPQ
jgi:alkanesulfonate monooxygenase SsuD/methylene tetrahydromethanopterin reductase-like flavin-dependent oxidoreductase (luciferase family)